MKEIELPYTIQTNDKLIVFSEPKSSNITFENKSQQWYYKTKIDGGVFPCGVKPKKCDWKLEKCENGLKFFVELKGSKIKEAVPQLEQTIELLAKNENGNCAFIVFSNKCSTSADENQNIVKTFWTKYKIHLFIVRSGSKFNLDS